MLFGQHMRGPTFIRKNTQYTHGDMDPGVSLSIEVTI